MEALLLNASPLAPAVSAALERCGLDISVFEVGSAAEAAGAIKGRNIVFAVVGAGDGGYDQAVRNLSAVFKAGHDVPALFFCGDGDLCARLELLFQDRPLYIFGLPAGAAAVGSAVRLLTESALLRAENLYSRMLLREGGDSGKETAPAPADSGDIQKARDFESFRHRREDESFARAKSRFISNVSHELRSPMVGIIGVADMLMDSPLSGDQRKHAETISRSAASLMKIIQDLIELARIEAGEREFFPMPASLRMLCSELIEKFRPAADPKNIKLNVNCHETAEGAFVFDCQAMHEILSRLIDNAVKFTDFGFVNIGLRAERSGDGSACVRIEVEDSGRGIKESAIASLFEVFAPDGGDLSRRGDGAGLGLAIVRGIVERMGGSISVESGEDYGTRFVIGLNLPLAEGAKGDSRS
jgi:signal transduction histidine kinase